MPMSRPGDICGGRLARFHRRSAAAAARASVRAEEPAAETPRATAPPRIGAPTGTSTAGSKPGSPAHTEYGNVSTVVVPFGTSGIVTRPPSWRERLSTSRSPSEPARAGPMPRPLSRTQSSASPIVSLTRNVTLMTPPSSSNAYLTELVTNSFRISPIGTARSSGMLTASNSVSIVRFGRRGSMLAQRLQVIAHIDAAGAFLEGELVVRKPDRHDAVHHAAD